MSRGEVTKQKIYRCRFRYLPTTKTGLMKEMSGDFIMKESIKKLKIHLLKYKIIMVK